MTEASARTAGPATTGGRRKSAQDRRAELVGIGLRLLVDTPIHELSIDRVAEQAGISRGLLFHYFDTKTDYYVAVVVAAARRMLDQARDPGEGSSRDRLRAITTGYVAFIRRRTRNYVSLVRGGAGGDERVVGAFRDVRSELTERVMNAAGIADPTSWQTLAVRGWLAMGEEIAIESTRCEVTTEQVVEALLDQLAATLRLVDQM
ncbi:TetR/AcrR family transcriptional regulator [Nocardia cyriacigeorgica]|uniref:TetR/AcrR family transcriptional regulator n=1 Tax=Nocardia cyriacigeorgica TaxID=135487 RepID=UPI0018956965|nr:TetR/AcrR family transcriptional regulator [Nocardia cyriacigeorgica]MBF6454978.1 TetR/AcrR family transcriptional regulator [Nocardia cyriacigeorgica]MBF6480929.1 TetR/AcrR family transcriptional regulator [Nocardia cyriacigeorgica]MBF6552873.1 TetR/AcrR family transcriptional regulator [Nocardia cyriacigeorgica]